jgi:hypothetical protein
MENGPTHPSPESIAFIRLLNLLLGVSKEEVEKEMQHEKQRTAKLRDPEKSKTSGNAT